MLLYLISGFSELRAVCMCDCGEVVSPTLDNVKRGLTKSCGCLHKEISGKQLSKMNTRHGKSNSATYISWRKMIDRCINSESTSFNRYGGRGIEVCEQWREFENFYADMGDRPEGKSIDRIDNNGNYEPRNCRWSTKTQQARNRSTNRLIQFKGRMVTIAEAAEISGLKYITIFMRINHGWSDEKALSVPVK